MLHSDLEALVGSTIHGRYEVETLLGVGGMGAVFKGRHTGLQRGVAIKVLHPEIGRDPSVSKRFDREAQSASRLDHPNCVRVTDFGTTENGTKYLVMELLEGGDLDGRLGQPWPPERAIATIEQVLRGLEHAHHVGIVHRDLKPENIFVTKDFRGEEVVKIVDFGIAKLIDEQGSEKLTRQGIVFGTPRYMAPEQAAGGKIDERTDLYAVGLIFYELLAGHPPFQSDEAAQLLRMQIMAPPPPLPSSVPAPLAQIVEKLIEKSKSDRFASAREVLDALAQIKPALATAAVVVAAQPILEPSSTAVLGSPPSSSGVAWQPAPEPTPAISGATLAASAVDLAAISMSAAAYSSPTASLATGSHASVATGSHASVATGSHASVATGAHASVSMPSVAAQPSAPTSGRRSLPLVLAGAAAVLLLAGVAVLVSSFNDEAESGASDQPEQAEPAAAVVAGEAQPSNLSTAPTTATQPDSAAKPAPSRAAVAPSSRPVRPTSGPDSKSKSKTDPKSNGSGSSSTTDSKSTTGPSNDPSGGSSDSTVPHDSSSDTARDPAGGTVDPSKAEQDSEAAAEQQKREREAREAEQREAEEDREQARGQGKGKGHDKKKVQ